jgi:hypothetical protein
MSTGTPDLLIHNPDRLRIVATLAVLPDGDALSVARLHNACAPSSTPDTCELTGPPATTDTSPWG